MTIIQKGEAMSLRNEQCNKVCRILDDVLANRPTERDSLITAVRKAFGALETVEEIRWCIWDVDIPSPTVPEYIEHHKQMKELMDRCDKLRSNLVILPSAQPEIIRCGDCLMHGVCRFEQGLGLDGYCSQAERREE